MIGLLRNGTKPTYRTRIKMDVEILGGMLLLVVSNGLKL